MTKKISIRQQTRIVPKEQIDFNEEYWQNKLSHNVAQDMEVSDCLTELGEDAEILGKRCAEKGR